jgi:prepilin peptidase CpaA
MSAVLLVTLLIMGVAVWFDLATRTIPDMCSIALAVLGVVGRLLDGPLAAAASVGIALLVGLAFVFLHARGVIGGGDVKLIVALAVGTPPGNMLDLLFVIAMSGGVLGILYLALSYVIPKPAVRPWAALPVRVAFVEANRIARRGPLPYAVAIAVGAISVGFGADVV